MGSFSTTCALTGEAISNNTDVVMMMITKNNKKRPMAVNTWDSYSPVPILFEGQYDGYGRLKNAKLFQSMELFNPEQMEIANQYVFKVLKNNTCADNSLLDESNAKNISELMNLNDWSFVKKDTKAEMIANVLELGMKSNPSNPLEIFNHYKGYFGTFQTIDEVKAKIEELKEKPLNNTNLIQFVYFEKSAFLKLVNEYGLTQGSPSADIYAQQVQHDRSNKIAPTFEEYCIMTGEENFAGANYPALKLTQGLKENIKQVMNREAIRKLENLQIHDITLVNDYFSMLGKSWMPSMAVSEDIKQYGHDDAMDFQRKLLIKPIANKPKP